MIHTKYRISRYIFHKYAEYATHCFFLSQNNKHKRLVISPLALRVTLNRAENLITPGFGGENFLDNLRLFFVANLIFISRGFHQKNFTFHASPVHDHDISREFA